MSVRYVAVQWNRHKRVYDALLLLGIGLYLAAFIGIGAAVWDGSFVILLIRALGTGAIVMLHVVLCIGPLARLSPRFNPLLYNRRHFGVVLFFVALAHGSLALGWYHGFGVANPLMSLLGPTDYQSLGLAALVILFLMAATSHDFWLRNLSPSAWKLLHTGVYAAYALLIAHVAMGVLQDERSMAYDLLLALGFAVVAGLHLGAGWRERMQPAKGDRWVDAGPADTIENNSGRVVELPDGSGRVAVFRYDGQVSALTNVCAHQMGPLGEGRVIDGCVTCPWHGYQYKPADGASPPPYTERIATHDVRIDRGRVLVKAQPNAPGTATPPANIEEPTHE